MKSGRGASAPAPCEEGRRSTRVDTARRRHGAPLPVALAIVVLLPVLGVLPASAATCAGDQSVESFDVAARARREAYEIDQVALVDVWVTDKLTGQPEQGVDAGLFIEGKGDRALIDVSKTDDQGHVLLRVHLKPSHVEPGWARALAAASDPVITPVYCTARYGYRRYPKLFRIER